MQKYYLEFLNKRIIKMFKYILFVSIIVTNSLAEADNYSFYENQSVIQSINNKCIFINNYEGNRFYLELNHCKERPIINEYTVNFSVNDGETGLKNFSLTDVSLETIEYTKKIKKDKVILEHYIQWEKKYVENIMGTKLNFHNNYKNKIMSSYYQIPQEFNTHIGLDKQKYILVIVAKYINNKVFAMSINTNESAKKETISTLTKFLNKITFCKLISNSICISYLSC